TLAGANVAFYHYLAQKYPDLHFQASGGVASLTEFSALRSAGVKGVILGRALLEGQFTVKEAILCWQNVSSHA
ncbi:MAG: 1-(5-phosphoribosyl)-5-((5-phosphoribosylamino)methylideneamino)imidazole-4-carboxamide isomerase, partial [Neisseriaceae bacterium]|nr:1-(5-phosphoribosyl)-5-((5-phosphoribosylamino)methylideneamino)imidazole-4-carboxamide isomerase [Neisseriaceae bacterium]